VRRVHEYVEIARLGDGHVVLRCRKCSHVYAPATENYKNGALRRIVPLYAGGEAVLPDGARGLAELHEYFCPGCGTQVDVEIHCPGVEGETKPIWDIKIDMSSAGAPAGKAKSAAPRRERVKA
jgi:acetone carboxylase gamma subunit